MDTTNSFYVFLVALNLILYLFLGYSNYTEYQCKTELGRSGRSVEDIEKICK